MLLLGLIAAGMFGNALRFPLFFNADYVFGGIFAMLALQSHGVRRGTVAALLIGIPLVFLWGHPYGTLLLTAEVAVVGWLHRRRGLGYIHADTLFWLLIGMPLGYVLYRFLVGISPTNCMFMMGKQMLNGLANMLVARLLYNALARRTRTPRLSFREVQVSLLAFFVLCPALILVVFGCRRDYFAADRQIRTSLLQSRERLEQLVRVWAENRVTAAQNLAGPAASKFQEQLQAALEQAARSGVGKGILFTLVDNDGRIVMTNRPGKHPLEPWGRGTGTLRNLSDGTSQWVPDRSMGVPNIERWGRSSYLTESTVDSPPGWKVIMEEPVAPFQQALFAGYAQDMALIILLFIGSLACAEWVSRLFADAIEQLGQITGGLSWKLSSPALPIRWPESSIRETHQLIVNFRDMADSLTEQFNTILKHNEGLEAKVQERTRELREREARYLALFDLSPDGVSVTRLRDGALTEVNTAWESLFGFTRSQVLGRDSLAVGLFKDSEERRALFETIPECGTLPARILNMIRSDGSPLLAEMTGRVMEICGERCLVSVLRDVTRDEQLRQDALESEVRARKAESLVLMAGSIAHDFNNFFQALQASLEIVELKAGGHPEILHSLSGAKTALINATALSWKMLDFSGNAMASLRPVHLAELISRWACGHDHAAGGPQLDLELEEVPQVAIDPEKLRRALDAILENAEEALEGAGMGPERIRLKLFLDPGQDRPGGSQGIWVADPPQGGPTVCLEISNDGPMPEPKVLHRMFDPFFSTKAMGRGLGLASALGLLKAHGAGVHVLPGAEKGMVFRIHFSPRSLSK